MKNTIITRVRKYLSLLALGSLLTTTTAWAAEVEAGFTSLFNGTDLTGWDGSAELWSVKDGAITGQTSKDKPLKGNTFLVWKGGTVEDFELRLSFKLTPGDTNNFANSGVQYRSKLADPANWGVGGYQADMEAGANYTGILYEERGRGIIAQRGQCVNIEPDGKLRVIGACGDSAGIEAGIKKNDWNEYIIIARGNQLTHVVNGRVTVMVTDDQAEKRASSGILALQVHAGPPMMAQFKNIRIKKY
jgi:hypothetical protein